MVLTFLEADLVKDLCCLTLVLSEFALILDTENPNSSFYTICQQPDFYGFLPFIFICSIVTFSLVSSPHTFTLGTVKMSQTVIMLYVLGLSDLLSPFDSHWTNFKAGS